MPSACALGTPLIGLSLNPTAYSPSRVPLLAVLRLCAPIYVPSLLLPADGPQAATPLRARSPGARHTLGTRLHMHGQNLFPRSVHRCDVQLARRLHALQRSAHLSNPASPVSNSCCCVGLFARSALHARVLYPCWYPDDAPYINTYHHI